MGEQLLARLDLLYGPECGDAAETRVVGRHEPAVGRKAMICLVGEASAVYGSVDGGVEGDVDEGRAAPVLALGVAPVYHDGVVAVLARGDAICARAGRRRGGDGIIAGAHLQSGRFLSLNKKYGIVLIRRLLSARFGNEKCCSCMQQ